jgi:hypothetical protein
MKRIERLLVISIVTALVTLAAMNVIRQWTLPQMVSAQFNPTPPGNTYIQKAIYGASAAAGVNTTSTVITVAAAGAGQRNYIKQVVCVNTSTTPTEIQFKEGNTVIAHAPCPEIGAAGANTPFDLPVRGTANTAMGVAFSVGVASGYVYLSGFVAN